MSLYHALQLLEDRKIYYYQINVKENSLRAGPLIIARMSWFLPPHEHLYIWYRVLYQKIKVWWNITRHSIFNLILTQETITALIFFITEKTGYIGMVK